MDERTIEVDLDGCTVLVRASGTPGEADASGGAATLDGALAGIRALAERMMDLLSTLQPDTATLEFSVELEARGSIILAVLCGGKAKGGITVGLEWKKKQPKFSQDAQSTE